MNLSFRSNLLFASTTTETTADLEHIFRALAYLDLRIRWAVERYRAYGLDPADENMGLYLSPDHVTNILNAEVSYAPWFKLNFNGHGQPTEPIPTDAFLPAIQRAKKEWVKFGQMQRKKGNITRLEKLVHEFDLNEIEIDAVLACLLGEIEPRYGDVYAFLQNDITKRKPSPNLILNLHTDKLQEKLNHSHLFETNSKLFHYQLLFRAEFPSIRGPILASNYLYLPSSIREYLLGKNMIDAQLTDNVDLILHPQPSPAIQYLTDRLAQVRGALEHQPIFVFRGEVGSGKLEAAAYVAQQLQKSMLTIDVATLANSTVGLHEGLRLAMRDGRLYDSVLYIINWEGQLLEGQLPRWIGKLLQEYPQVVILSGNTEWYPTRIFDRRTFLVKFDALNYTERANLWRHYVPHEHVPVSHVANHFRFTWGQIRDSATTAQDVAHLENRALTEQDVLAASRDHSNQKLGTLATKIRPNYSWDDIVIPADTMRQLREIVNTVRQRPLVYEEWGFGTKMSMGKGVNALFAGESGTGKTMAADIIANSLGLDLYRIDLSAIVSKYIGETEKNLNQIFTEASTSNAILFFDEADSLFGKRSEVKDSHDRYANIETSYLLQRMEAYDGVVILATNLRANLDDAFTRRLHFVIDFPFPKADRREKIWEITFPSQTPVNNDVNFKILAERYDLSGGNIRNIVLASAFLAAERGESVGMLDLIHATKREYQKLGRLIRIDDFRWPVE